MSNKYQHRRGIDIKTYTIYTLKHGNKEEKRELMSCFKSKIKITKGMVEIIH